MRILLVEDDPILGDLICELLTEQSQVVTLAPTATAAFLELAKAKHDAVLLDLQLGSGRGEMMIERARNAGCRIPPVVIFSAQPIADIMEAAKILRPIAVVRKPCLIAELLDALSKVGDGNATPAEAG